MILRNTNGTYEIYDIGNNAILAGYKLGQVGTDWAYITLGSFFSNDTTDMLPRNSSNGAFEVYNVSNNQIVGAAALGAIGLNWGFAGLRDFNSDHTSDTLLRNSGTGQFELCDINKHQISFATSLGTVGLDWQVAGFGDFDGDGATDMLRNSNTGIHVFCASNEDVDGTATRACPSCAPPLSAASRVNPIRHAFNCLASVSLP
jgi:hypothetical protein